jgi:hypothetical protein
LPLKLPFEDLEHRGERGLQPVVNVAVLQVSRLTAASVTKPQECKGRKI